MELRSRSRSITPFLTEAFIEGETFEESNHVVVTRSARKSTRTVNSSSEDIVTIRNAVKNKNKSVKDVDAFFKTSDYSSEEGDETSTESHLSQNEKNQILEDARKAANGSAGVSALNLYRQAGRYWDKYPKTDYTYSPHSRDRVEIAPGVVQMPNMSRKSIHSQSTNTDESSFYTSGSQYIRKKLFGSQEGESFVINRRSSNRTVISHIMSFFLSIYSVFYWCFYSVYRVSNSSTIWFGKILHHLSSRLMLFDTWFLKKLQSGKRSRRIIALCLIPLLLLAGWWLLSSTSSAIYSSFTNPSKPVLPILPEESKILEKPSLVAATSNKLELDSDEIVEKILNSPQLQTIINNHYSSISLGKSENEEYATIINELKEEIQKVKNDFSTQNLKNENFDRILSQIRSENFRNIAVLTQKLNRCCNKPGINLEPFVANVLGRLLNDHEFLSNQKGLSDWLNALFIARHDLEERLSNLTQNLPKNFEAPIEATADKVMERVVGKLDIKNFESGSINVDEVKRIVKYALHIYDADKTGLVDYAMEPMGGQVITTRCTENYHAGTAVISVLGIPVWYPTNSPRTVITPEINPGECWAFQNFPGFLLIKLSNRIKVEAFSLEHINKLLVPGGRIDSAPKEFEVWGFNDENDKDPVQIGNYIYDIDGEPIQFFSAQEHGLSFTLVEIRIKSNHGNPNYTCLYRFRVHGSINEAR